MKNDPRDLKKDFLGDRRKSLEDEFFSKENQRLLDALRKKEAAEARKDALSAASGIDNADVLDQLDQHDIEPQTVAALAVVPLVVVAWADGQLEEKERLAVIAGAEAAGIQVGSPSHVLLGSWLEQPPADRLLEVWKDYVAALCKTLDRSAAQVLKKDILDRARGVAAAAGGFLGFGSKVSDVERAVLDELEAAFD